MGELGFSERNLLVYDWPGDKQIAGINNTGCSIQRCEISMIKIKCERNGVKLAVDTVTVGIL